MGSWERTCTLLYIIFHVGSKGMEEYIATNIYIYICICIFRVL